MKILLSSVLLCFFYSVSWANESKTAQSIPNKISFNHVDGSSVVLSLDSFEKIIFSEEQSTFSVFDSLNTRTYPLSSLRTITFFYDVVDDPSLPDEGGGPSDGDDITTDADNVLSVKVDLYAVGNEMLQAVCAEGIAHIRLFSVSGHLLYSVHTADMPDKVTFSTQNIPSGVCIVVVETASYSSIHKILIK